MVHHQQHLLKPLWIATAITHHPCIVLLITFSILIVMIFLDGLVFELAVNSDRAFLVEQDPYVTQFDAYNLATEKTSQSDSNEALEPQTEQVGGWTVQWMFQLTTADKKVSDSTDYWILTPSYLKTIIKYEDKVFADEEFSDNFCYVVDTSSYDCSYFSVARNVYEHFNQSYSSMSTDSIKEYVYSLQLNGYMNALVLSSFNGEYETTNQTYMYRSFYFGGAPIPTKTVKNDTTGAVISKTSKYDNFDDETDKQQEIFKQWGVPLWVDTVVNHNSHLVENKIRVIVLIGAILNDWFSNLLQQGMSFITFAMMAVLFWMTVHLQSLFLSIVAMIGIMMSFPFAYFLYHYLYGIAYFDTLSVLIVFVLLGIGADDVFVFTDAWHQGAHFIDDKNDILQRMTFAYRRASKAMLVTQVTTFFAFLATSFSLLMPIAGFGIWAATIVACNYILVITAYPSFLMFHHKYIKSFEQKYCCFCCKKMGMKPITRDPTRAPTKSEISRDTVKRAAGPQTVSTSNGPQPDGQGTVGHVSFEDQVTQLQAVSDGNLEKRGPDIKLSVQTNLDNDDTKGADDSELYPASVHQPYSPNDTGVHYREIELFFGHKWTAWMTSIKEAILIFFTILFGLSIWFATWIEGQDENEQWLRDDHYLQQTIDMISEFSASEEDGLVTVDLMWGIEGVDRSGTDTYDPEDYGKVVWDSSFDLSTPDAQQYLYDTAVELSESDLVYSTSGVDAVMFHLVNYTESLNESFPWTYMSESDPSYSDSTQKEKFAELMYNFTQSSYGAEVAASAYIYVEEKSNGKYILRFIGLNAQLETTWDDAASEAMEARDDWDKWLDDTYFDSNDCPKGVCKPIISSIRFAWLRSMREFVNSALQGIAIAMPLAFAVLLGSTHNWIMACLATTVIIGIIGCELAVMGLQGWKFGISESIAIVIIIGFSVDYVVHFANAYLECDSPNRKDRLQFSLLTMGISVVSGAITTLLAGMFLLFPEFVFFQKMGILIISTILLSLTWSMVFFVAAVAKCGPERDRGNIPFDKVYAKIRESIVKPKNDVQNDDTAAAANEQLQPVR